MDFSHQVTLRGQESKRYILHFKLTTSITDTYALLLLSLTGKAVEVFGRNM